MTRASKDNEITPVLPGRGRTLVVKVGSAVLVSAEGGAGTDGIGVVDRAVIGSIAGGVAAARAAGWRCVVVTSGAVACGVARLAEDPNAVAWGGRAPRTIVEKQAAAAVGQPLLARAWSAALANAGVVAAQVLLTSDDFEDRGRYLNASRTLGALLDAGCVPVINENDSVAFDELALGDNDRLSALVARAIGADLLALLSTAPGVEDESGRVVPTLGSTSGDLSRAMSWVRPETSGVGTGGMASKLDAARLASESGADVLIAPGRAVGVVGEIVHAAGEGFAGSWPGTHVPARAQGGSNARGRRGWIGAAARADGTVRIDAGAVRAIVERGASLLPVGVTAVEGSFDAGGVVDIVGPAGERVARGVSAYSAADARAIAGRGTDEIEGVLGSVYAESLVHRDEMSVLGEGREP